MTLNRYETLLYEKNKNYYTTLESKSFSYVLRCLETIERLFHCLGFLGAHLPYNDFFVIRSVRIQKYFVPQYYNL